MNYPVVLDDFLPINLFNSVLDEFCYANWTFDNQDSYGKSTNKNSLRGHFQCDLILHCVSDYVQRTLKRHFCHSFVLDRWHINGQFFSQESNLHIDSTDENTITFVLFTNHSWCTNWGGEFCYYDDHIDDYRFVAYKPNRAVFFPSNKEHCGRAPNSNTDQMRTSIAFVYNSL